MNRLLFFIILASFGLSANAQEFRNGVGLRLGWSTGFEYRIFSGETESYKFLLSTRDKGVQIHALKEFHQYDLFNFTDQLVFFYGGGIHAGYERWNVVHYYNNTQWYDTHTAFIAGVDGLVGLEYVFFRAPVSLGIEAKPYFEFFGREFFDIQIFDFAFTVKYLF